MVFSQPRRALHADFAVAQLQITGARFQHMARDAEKLFLDDAGGADQRAHRPRRIALRAGARSGETVVGVGIGDADVGRIDLQLLGQDHGRHGLGAVAPEQRVQRDHDLAQGIDLDADPLGRARQRKPANDRFMSCYWLHYVLLRRSVNCRIWCVLTPRQSYPVEFGLRALIHRSKFDRMIFTGLLDVLLALDMFGQF